MKFVMEFLTYQQLVRVSKQVINTYNNIALISPFLSHYTQTGRVMGSLDPGLIHDTPSTIVVILSRCDKSFLSMKYDSAKCYTSMSHEQFNDIFQVKNWFKLIIWIKTMKTYKIFCINDSLGKNILYPTKVPHVLRDM